MDVFEDFLQRGLWSDAVLHLEKATQELSSLSMLPMSAKGRALSNHVSLCGAVRDACDFAVSFERSILTRSGLVKAGAGTWAVRTLREVSHARLNTAAAASALRRLGASAEARAAVGQAGAVRALLEAWKAHERCVEVVEALSVLCIGHVDNLDRFIRIGGVNWAISVLRRGARTERPDLDREVLLLLGVCALCLPNEGHAGSLVPAVIEVLRRANNSECRDPSLAAAAIGVLANVGESVAREYYMTRGKSDERVPGYDVSDSAVVVSEVLHAWQTWRHVRAVVSPASWALCAMLRADQVHFEAEERETIRALVASNPIESSTVRALSDLVTDSELKLHTRPCSERESGATPSPKRRRPSSENSKEVTAPPELTKDIIPVGLTGDSSSTECGSAAETPSSSPDRMSTRSATPKRHPPPTVDDLDTDLLADLRASRGGIACSIVAQASSLSEANLLRGSASIDSPSPRRSSRKR